MDIHQTKELYWLSVTVLMTAMLWLPYILHRIVEHGLWNALYDPQGETVTQTPWANRMMRAHANAVENLVIFAPLVLLLHAQGITTSFTTSASAIYFFARATHYLVFSFGIPLLRVPAFLTGFACQIVIAASLFGWM